MLDLILIAKYPKLTNILESLGKLKFDKTFFLAATTPQEIYDIISALDTNKSLGPNSIPVIIIRLMCQFHLKWVARLLCLF